MSKGIKVSHQLIVNTIQDLGWGILYCCNENLVVYYCSEVVKKYCENQIFKSLPFTPKILEE